MKKLAITFLVLVLALEMIACGKQNDSSNGRTGSDTGAETAAENETPKDREAIAEELGITVEEVEKLEEYLQVEEVRSEEHLILMAENCDLRYGEDTTLNLTLRIPASWNEEDITLYFDGDILTTLTADELTSKGKAELGEVPYIDFQAEVTVSDQGDEDTSFSKVLKAVKGDQESNEVVLYREVEVPPETIETAGRILDEIGTIALSYSGSEKQNGGTQETGKVGGSEEVLEEVYAYLKNSPEIGKVQRNGKRIDFITKDGFSSFFEIKDPNMNLAGSGEGPTTEPGTLEKKFTHDYSFREALIDPDVMVLRPVSSNDDTRTGNVHVTAGKTLAGKLDGECTVFSDADCLRRDTFSDMGKYGTIMFTTHSGIGTRADGSTIVNWTFYDQIVDFDDAWNNVDENFIESEDVIWQLLDSQNFKNTVKGEHGQYWNIKFFADENANQASFGLAFIENEQGKWGKSEIHYQVSMYSDAIMYYCSDIRFPNTIIYLGSCYSIADSRFNRFLLDHGASYVIGYKKTIACPTEERLCRLLFQEFMKENEDEKTQDSAHTYSVQQGSVNVILRNRWNLVDNTFGMVESAVSTDASRFMSSVCNNGQRGFWYKGYGSIEGTVTDSEGNLIDGAEIIAHRYFLKNGKDYKLQEEMRTSTDANGHYQFSKIDWGEYLIQAYSDGKEGFRSTAFAAAEKKDQDIQLKDNETSTHPENAAASDNWYYVMENIIAKILKYSKDISVSEDTGIISGGVLTNSMQFYDGKLYVSGGDGLYVYDEANGSREEISLNNCSLRLYEWQIYKDKLYYIYSDQNGKYFLKCADLSGKPIGESIALHNNPNYANDTPKFFIQDSNLYYTEFLPAKEQEDVKPVMNNHFVLDKEHMSYRIWRVPIEGGEQETIYSGAEGYSLYLRDINSEYLAVTLNNYNDGGNSELILIPLKSDGPVTVVADNNSSVYNEIIDAHFYKNTVVYTDIGEGLHQYDIVTGETKFLTDQIFRAFAILDDYCVMEVFDSTFEKYAVWYSLTGDQ